MTTESGQFARPSYTPQQLHEVYDRINLPSRYRYEPGDFSKEVVRHRDGHGFLAALHRHCLAHIPFENLELHYSAYHQISIHPDALFTKIVSQRMGRGGCCMENNVFLGTVLRSLGFNVRSLGARLNVQNQPGNETIGQCRYGAWSHMINLVTIRGEAFVVDVGFGTGGPTHPMPLEDGFMQMNIAPNQQIRIRKDSIPENEEQRNKMWILERQGSKNGPWTPMYCFQDNVCFLPGDFEVMSFFISAHRTSFFTYRVICAKFLLDEKQEEIVGEVVMYEGRVTRRLRGGEEEFVELKTESERVQALERYFGVTLSQAQREGIKDMVTDMGS